MKIRTAFILASSSLALLSGCGTLPDGKPFADASSALAASVEASGWAVVDSMTDAGNLMPADKAAYDKLRNDFEAAWAHRVAATEAAAWYSEDIAALIDSGNAGAEAAVEVADSLQTLAEAVNLAAPAVGVATDVAGFVFARIAIVRASKGLESAVAQAQPAVDKIADHIVSESDKQLKSILLAVFMNIQSGIKSAYDDDASFAREAAKRRQVQRQLALGDPKALPRLLEYDRIQSNVTASLRQRDRKLDQAAAAYRARRQLVNAMSDATIAWAQTHRDLAVAIQEKRKVSTAELTSTVAELRALSKKVSEL